MRKIYLFAVVCLTVVGITACASDKGNKGNKVQDFAESFSRYLKTNQLDSIKAVYPSANFDSIAPLTADSIQITETNGIYRIDFGGNKWIEAKENEDGTFTVENSNGIAAFPQDKYEIAVNTGMFNDSIPDVKKQELLRDSTYFAWLEKKGSKVKENLKLSIGKIKAVECDNLSNYDITWPVTVTNKGNSTIKGASYNVITRWYSYWGDGRPGKGTKITIKGEELVPGETKTFTFRKKAFALNPPTLEYNISNKDFIEIYKSTGKEYQEYLDSKK